MPAWLQHRENSEQGEAREEAETESKNGPNGCKLQGWGLIVNAMECHEMFQV